MVTILVNNYFSDFNVYNDSVRRYEQTTKIKLSFVELKAIYRAYNSYENKDFVYILNVEETN